MLRGLKSGWKMPISFGYCESQTKTPQLLCCIKEIVKTITTCGFKIVATVCDQGSSNVAAINSLIQDTARRKWQHDEKHRTYSFRIVITFCYIAYSIIAYSIIYIQEILLNYMMPRSYHSLILHI